MPEKTKQEKDSRKGAEEKTEKNRVENPGIEEQANWSQDQREKSYYYDDSYGYEIYNPEDEDDE